MRDHSAALAFRCSGTQLPTLTGEPSSFSMFVIGWTLGEVAPARQTSPTPLGGHRRTSTSASTSSARLAAGHRRLRRHAPGLASKGTYRKVNSFAAFGVWRTDTAGKLSHFNGRLDDKPLRYGGKHRHCRWTSPGAGGLPVRQEPCRPGPVPGKRRPARADGEPPATKSDTATRHLRCRRGIQHVIRRSGTKGWPPPAQEAPRGGQPPASIKKQFEAPTTVRQTINKR